jgi:hypothetical protein
MVDGVYGNKNYSSISHVYITATGGNYEFNDNFDAGYTLRVSMKYSDKKLMAKITSVLRDNNFGCLPSTKFTVDAHRNFEHPTEYEAEKILASITDRIYQKLT